MQIVTHCIGGADLGQGTVCANAVDVDGILMFRDQKMAAGIDTEAANAIVIGEEGRSGDLGQLAGTLVDAEDADTIIKQKEEPACGIGHDNAEASRIVNL